MNFSPSGSPPLPGYIQLMWSMARRKGWMGYKLEIWHSMRLQIKKKSNFFCPGKHMCTLGWPSMLFPSHQNLLPASDVRNSVSYYPVCELLCSFMSYDCFSYDLVFVFICEIPIVPEILRETPYIRKDWGWKGFFPELQTWLTRWKSTPMLKFWLCDSNFNCSLRGIWVHP